MLDRSRAESASPRARAVAFAVAACFALVIALWLTFAGIDYLINGCRCHEPLFGGWYGAGLLVIAVPFYVAGGLLAARAVRAAKRKLEG